MKKYFLLLLISVISANYLIAQNLDSLNQFTGWDESNPLYKIQKFTNEKFTYSKVLDSGDKLFTADTAMNFRIWDLTTGKLLYSKVVPHQLPVYIVNDSLVIFAGINYPGNKNPLVLYNLNQGLIIKESDETSFGEYKKPSISISPQSKVFVSFFWEGDRYLQLKHYKYNNIFFEKDSLFQAELYGQFNFISENIFICEKEDYSLTPWNRFTKATRRQNLILTNNGKEKLFTPYSTPATSSFPSYIELLKINTEIELNPDKTRCYYLYNQNKLTLWDTETLTLISERTMKENVSSFFIDKFNRLIYYVPNEKSLRVYNSKNDSYMSIDLEKDFGNCLYNLIKLNNIIYLCSDKGKIVEIDFEKIIPQKTIVANKDTAISTEEINYRIASIPDIVSAYWDFGDGNTSDEISPTHNYLEPGEYEVSVYCRDINEEEETLVIPINTHIKEIYYPKCKANYYYGTAPLKITCKNRTLKIPDNTISKWYLDKDTVGVLGEEYSTTLNEGSHSIRMEFELNGEKYSDRIYLKAFSKTDSTSQILYTEKLGYMYYPDYPTAIIYYNRTYSANLGENIFALGIHSYYKDPNQHDSPMESEKVSICNGAISNKIKEYGCNSSTRIYPFLDRGYIINSYFFNQNNYLLFKKNLNFSDSYAILNKSKYFALYNNSSISIYNKRADLISNKTWNNFLQNNLKNIKQVFISGNENYDFDDFYVVCNQENSVNICKLDNDLTVIQNKELSHTGILKSVIRTHENNLILLYEDGTFYIFNKLLNAAKLSTKGLDYDFLDFIGNKIITTKINGNYQDCKLYNPRLVLIDSIKLYLDYSGFTWKTQFIYNLENKSVIYYNHGDRPTYSYPFYEKHFQIYFPRMNDSTLDAAFPIDTIPDDPPDTTKSDTIVYKINTPFPNPADDFVKIEVDILENPKVEVYNVLGTLVPIEYSKTKRKDKDLYWINLSLLPKGTYYYKISNGQKSFTGRFVKE